MLLRGLNIVASRNDLQPKIGLERFLPREDIVSVQSNINFYLAQWGIFIKVLPGVAAAKGKANNPQHRATGGQFHVSQIITFATFH